MSKATNAIHKTLQQHPELGPILERFEDLLERYERSSNPSDMVEMYVLDVAALFRYIVQKQLSSKIGCHPVDRPLI